MSGSTVADALRRNIDLEHQAILLYLLVGWTSGDHHVEVQLEKIAREEMYHLRWLAHTAVALGIEVQLGPVDVPDLANRSPLQALKEDMAHEAAVIEEYERQMETIEIPRVRRVLQRLIDDSREHQRRLARLVEKWEARLASGEAAPEGQEPLDPHRAARLQKALEEEYTAILQYLSHSFASAHSEASVLLEDVAIQEMKHMGELGEALAERGVLPDVRAGIIYTGRAVTDRIAANMRDEQLAHQQYEQWATGESDAEIKEMWERLAYQEADHALLFDELLSEEEGSVEKTDEQGCRSEPRPARLTVGNLFRRT